MNEAQSAAALSSERLALAQMRYTAAAVNTTSSATQLASAHLAVSSAQQSHERAAQALTDAQTRLNDTHRGAVGYLAAHSASLGEWALAAGAAGGAALGLVSALAHVGETFENINRGLELTNASTGAAMEEMKTHADALVGAVDTATNQIGSDMGVLASRLSLEPGAALDSLTHNVEMLRDRFGQLNTPALTAGFREFHVEASQTNDAMASLTQTAIGVGANVGTVVTQLAAGGTTLAEAGLNYQQAAYLISQADKDIGEGGAQKAITGIEMGMKDAAKHGMDFQTYIRDVMYSLGEFQRQGETEKFDMLAGQAFGTRKWAEVQAIFKDYNDALRASNQELAASPGYMADLEKRTRNLDNVFHQLRNHIEAALAPPGENAVDFVGDKVKELMAWVDAHRDDLRQLFVTGLDAAEKLLQMITDIAGWLGRYPGTIAAAIVVFGTWKSIEGVAALITSLQTIDALLKGMPASAALAGSGIATGLAPAIAALTTLAALWNLHGDSAPTNIGPGADDRQKRLEAGKAYADSHGGQVPPGYAQWLDKGGAPPPGITMPGAAPGTPFFDDQGHPLDASGKPIPNAGPAYTPGDKSYAPGATGGPAAGWAGGPTPGGPGSPELIEPDGPKAKKGPRLPPAPEVPYGAGYGAPPEIGETERHYAARQHLLEEQHALAEDQARLDQLEKSANATQDDILKVKNKILTDRGNILKAEGELYQREQGTLKRRGDALEELGAKIDQDFGISKGLPGIAENLTKFLANLAFSPVYGALKGADAALGGPTYGGKGIAGMIGLAAGMGGPGAAEGGGETGWTGSGWGGPAAPGLGGKLPSFGGSGAGGGGRGRGGLPGIIANLLGGGGAGGVGGVGATPGAAVPGSLSALLNSGGGGGGGGDFGASAGHPTTAPPDENALRQWVETNFGIKNTFGTGSWENAAHDDDGKWHHPKQSMTDFRGPTLPSGDEKFGYGFDFHGTTEQMDALANWVAKNDPQNTLELIHQGPGFDPSRGISNTRQYNFGAGLNSEHQDHVHWALTAPPYAVGGPGGAGLSNAQGPGGGPPGGGTGGPGGGAPGGGAPGGGGSLNWDALAAAEASGNWSANTGNGYYGGLQFDMQTWRASKPEGAPDNPALATKEQQIAAATKALRARGGPQSLWPQNWSKLGWGPGMAEGGATPPSPLPLGAVPIVAHENEHVLTSADVNALGGQQGVYAMREQLHAGEGQPGGGPPTPRAGAPAPQMQAHPGGPTPGPSLIGGMAPSPGWGSGFEVTGGGLVGVAESIPATAAAMGIAAAAAAYYGGAIEDLPSFLDGGDPSGGASAGGGGSPGGAGGGGSPGGSITSALIGIGFQELNEAISKGGQAVGAGVSGLMQTFGPGQFAQSKQAQTGWLSKLVGGFAGAQPQLPNVAGGKGSTPGLTPEQAASQHQSAGLGGAGALGPDGQDNGPNPLVHIENLNNYGNENSMGKAVGDHVQAGYNINAQTGGR